MFLKSIFTSTRADKADEKATDQADFVMVGDPKSIRQNQLDKEPALDVDDIQGDIILGFNKRYQFVTLIEFRTMQEEKTYMMDDVKKWLNENVLPRVSSTRDVIDDHEMHRNGVRETKALVNVSFTFDGLTLLLAGSELWSDLDKLSEVNPFRIGAQKRSTLLGDAVSGRGSAQEWEFGIKDVSDVHMQINIAGDSKDVIEAAWNTIVVDAADAGIIRIVSKDLGERGVEGGAFYGHEHFGFKDGLSQPVIRGTYINEQGEKEFVVRRKLSEGDPRYGDYSKPGFRLVDPSAFLSGYGDADSELDTIAWLKGSSYLVYRKFYQDVPKFWDCAMTKAQEAQSKNGVLASMDVKELAGQIGSKVIGRWWDGTPLFWKPMSGMYYPPNPDEVNVTKLPSDGLLNGFEYGNDHQQPWMMKNGTQIPSVQRGAYPSDSSSRGQFCPMSGHIRKMNARDEATDMGPASETLKHRVIRRAITYGPRKKDVFSGVDGVDRGLLFNMYMGDIARSFEFLMCHWADSNDRPFDGGDDCLIGQPTRSGNGPDCGDEERVRRLSMTIGLDEKTCPFVMEEKGFFVIPKGMAYMLTISKSAIKCLVTGRVPNGSDSESTVYMPPANQRDYAYKRSYEQWDECLTDIFDDCVWGPVSVGSVSSGVGVGTYPNGVAYRLPKYGEGAPYLQLRSPKEMVGLSKKFEREMVEKKISWGGFPRRVKNLFAKNGSSDPLGPYKYVEIPGWPAKDVQSKRYGKQLVAKARQMDEYCEWFTTRDATTNKIIRLDITAEGPEYWRNMVMGPEREVALELYRKYVSPQVEMEDLLDENGEYDPYNKWNTTEGIMHLNCPPNSLGAEVYIAAEASMRWRESVDGEDLTDAAQLIACGEYGLWSRASDPTIGATVNELIRGGYLVSLKNPVGLYLEELNTAGWLDPQGNVLSREQIDKIVTYERGSEQFGWVRIRVEVPSDMGFVLGDVTLGGAPLEFGGQLIDASVTVFLMGTAMDGSGIIDEEETAKQFVVAKKQWSDGGGIHVPPNKVDVFPPPVDKVWMTRVRRCD